MSSVMDGAPPHGGERNQFRAEQKRVALWLLLRFSRGAAAALSARDIDTATPREIKQILAEKVRRDEVGTTFYMDLGQRVVETLAKQGLHYTEWLQNLKGMSDPVLRKLIRQTGMPNPTQWRTGGVEKGASISVKKGAATAQAAPSGPRRSTTSRRAAAKKKRRKAALLTGKRPPTGKKRQKKKKKKKKKKGLHQ